MDHLLGVFNLLKQVNAPLFVCIGGALHSIYGTNAFKTVALEPSEENRACIANLFSKKAERLAFLFHMCNRPSNLSVGKLHNRFTGQLLAGVIDLELWGLRLIEAANFIDQGKENRLRSMWPSIAIVWDHHVPRANCDRPVSRPALHLNIHSIDTGDTKATSMRTFLGKNGKIIINKDELESCIVGFVTANACGHSVTDNLWGFVIRGEYAFGMPYSPLWLLSKFITSKLSCSNISILCILEIDIKRMGNANADPSMLEVFVEIPPEQAKVNLKSILSAPSDAQDRFQNEIMFKSSLQRFGYAIVTVSDEDKSIIADAFGAFQALHRLLYGQSKQKRFKSITNFDGKRYYGWTGNQGRDWIQLRLGVEQPVVLETMVKDIVGRLELLDSDSISLGQKVEGDKEDLCEVVSSLILRMIQATMLLDNHCRALYGVLTGPNTSSKVCTSEASHKQSTSLFSSNSKGICPGVHRIYCYDREWVEQKNNNFGIHSDMGLLTLSPRSTSSALSLLKPHTFEILRPEIGLQENDWLVLAGESLAYLSNNQYPAALHWVDDSFLAPSLTDGTMLTDKRTDERLRYSMPYFLRANPEYELQRIVRSPADKNLVNYAAKTASFIDENAIGSMTCRVLMNEHIGTKRPWRMDILDDF